MAKKKKSKTVEMRTVCMADITPTPKGAPKSLAQVQKMIDDKINPVIARLDRIVNAISKAKKVKGL